MKEVKVFKKSPKGGLMPIPTAIKKGDHVVLYGRGNPKGVIVKVDKSLYHGGKGSMWYDVKLSSGKVITRRAWDFKVVMR